MSYLTFYPCVQVHAQNELELLEALRVQCDTTGSGGVATNWNKVGEGVSEVSGGVAPQNLETLTWQVGKNIKSII